MDENLAHAASAVFLAGILASFASGALLIAFEELYWRNQINRWMFTGWVKAHSVMDLRPRRRRGLLGGMRRTGEALYPDRHDILLNANLSEGTYSLPGSQFTAVLSSLVQVTIERDPSIRENTLASMLIVLGQLIVKRGEGIPDRELVSVPDSVPYLNEQDKLRFVERALDDLQAHFVTHWNQLRYLLSLCMAMAYASAIFPATFERDASFSFRSAALALAFIASCASFGPIMRDALLRFSGRQSRE